MLAVQFARLIEMNSEQERALLPAERATRCRTEEVMALQLNTGDPPKASSPQAGARGDALEPGDADLWSSVETAAQTSLPEFLCRQRWYPAKDQGAPEVSRLSLIPWRFGTG